MKYSYEELVKDLQIGHEVMFEYHKDTYSISHNSSGYHLTKYSDFQNALSYESIENLLQFARIDNIKLEHMWVFVENISVS